MGLFKRITSAIRETAREAAAAPPQNVSPASTTSRALPPQPTAPPVETAGDLMVEWGTPAATAVLRFADIAVPIIEKIVASVSAVWKRIQPYGPQDFAPLILGLLLLFYGGTWPVTLAAVEAFRICGWDRTKRSLTLIHQQLRIAYDAHKKDNQVDDNNDGVADVLQITKSQLMHRKAALFLRSTDPAAVNEGIQGLTAGASAVMATLRVKFAQTITLGVSIGDVFTRATNTLLRPALEKAVPKEYHKWLDMGISYACRSIAVTFAWWCTQIISAMHSSTRGAQLVIQGINVLAVRFHIPLPVRLGPENVAFPVICTALGSLGLLSQLKRGFSLPFPFNLLLFPVSILEWLLFWCLSSK